MTTSRRSFALFASGVLLATAFWTGLYAWWMWQNQPSGHYAGAMYFWIRHFYGSLAVCVVSLLSAIFATAGFADAKKVHPDFPAVTESGGDAEAG